MFKNMISTFLKKHIAKFLPDYMIPNFFIWLEEMPLTQNGKLDRKKLPDIDRDASEHDNIIEPNTITEKKVAKIWKNILDPPNYSEINC